MAMLKEKHMRTSLQVAPLTIQKSLYLGADLLDGSSLQDGPLHSRSGSQTQMTPPATPNYIETETAMEAEDSMTAGMLPMPSPVFNNFLRAYYPFHPSYAMTDSAVTLPLKEGDVILVHSIHTNGWADGTLLPSGARGWLPTNYCDAYEPEEIRSLLRALLDFWDLLRSTAVNDTEMFGNQEFMKGIIAGVRYLLERTHCLTRESVTIQRHDGLRRARKHLLSELSSLVKVAKRLQEYQRRDPSGEEGNDIVDEMILKAFKIVTHGVRFLDILDEDRRQRAPAVTVMATVMEEATVPPTPPAETTTFDAATRDNSGNDPAPCDTSETTQTTGPLANKRLSSAQAPASTTSARRMSQSNSQLVNRLSSSVSHRVSLVGSSPASNAQNLVLPRLTERHDTFLSYLGSFIGRLHLQTQSQPHLAFAIKQSATSGGELLVVVDVVCARDTLSRELLEDRRTAMYDSIVDLVHVARDILTNSTSDVEDVIMPQDNSRLLYAATGCVKATGECVAKTKWVVERIGDFEFEFDNGSLHVDFDLGILDTISAERERSVAASESASIAESVVSSAVSELPAHAQASSSRPTMLAVDKPLPEVPQQESEVNLPPQISPPTSRPQSLLFEDHHSLRTPSISSVRPAAPLLPKLATTTLTQDEYSPSEPSAGHDGEFTSSFRSESMTVSSAGTASTYMSRGSESSLISQTSTRATTPDHMAIVHHQSSSMDYNADSAAHSEDADDVESKLLVKTYANELIVNKEGQVAGGSLPALVERLTTYESTPDAMFVSTFYLTFRLFCTPVKLAETLIDRFDYVGEAPQMATPVRLRVYNVFKGWLESHWREDTDRDALMQIEAFAEFKLNSVLPSAARRLLELTQRVSSTDGSLVPRQVPSIGKMSAAVPQYVPADTPIPAAVMTKSQMHVLGNWKSGGSCPSILDFDPQEIARQLTLKQMNIFSAIMPDELLDYAKNPQRAPNIKAMTALSTGLSNLVADTILDYDEVKKRAAVIKQWIKIAHQCLQLHNYEALMSIMCILNGSTITRLRKTWDLLSQKRREMHKNLSAIVKPSQTHKAVRSRLQGLAPPCLPFLGMFLTDLTFVDAGNPSTRQLPDDGTEQGGLTVINFDKHTKTAKTISEIQRFQIPYRLAEVPDLQDWIQNQVDRVRELDKPGLNVQIKFYRKSQLLEPKETQALRTPMETPAPASSTREPGQRPDLFGWMRGNSHASTAGSTTAVNNTANMI